MEEDQRNHLKSKCRIHAEQKEERPEEGLLLTMRCAALYPKILDSRQTKQVEELQLE